jgi:outer membrane immunogenic protein
VTLGRLQTAAFALACSCSIAVAGDWSGFYAGASAGFAETNDTWTNTGNPDFNDVGKRAFIGIQGGHNWQFGHTIVGLEADYLFANVQASVSCPDPAMLCGHQLSNLGSVRGRIGWLGTPSAMIYFTGGYGWGAAKWTQQDAVTGDTSAGGTASHTVSGLVLGAGAEYMVAKNWTIKGEYLHYDLGHFTPTASDFPGGQPTFKLFADTYKLGLNFKF